MYPKLLQYFTLAFSLFVFSILPVSAQVISARAAVVIRVDGEVFYRCRDKKKEALVLDENSILHDRDTILTTLSGSVLLSLNPDSYLLVDSDSFVEIKQTELDKMHFDIERGEIFLFIRSLDNGASIVVHTPPRILTIHKGGWYRVMVSSTGNTEANVLRGELRYINKHGDLVKIKKGRQVNFVKKTGPLIKESKAGSKK